MDAFSSDGHLSDLGLEQILLGQRDDDPRIEAHLARCAGCSQRLDAARLDEARPLPPLRATQRPANRPWRLVGLVAAAALIVLGLLFRGQQPPDQPGFRTKSPAVGFEVWVDEGASARRLASHDRARAGDRLGFRVHTATDRHLMVIDIDSSGSVFPCFPQGSEPSSRLVEATVRPIELPQAVRLDDRPGPERLVAVFCPAPFTLSELGDPGRSDAPIVPPGCTMREVWIDKEPR